MVENIVPVEFQLKLRKTTFDTYPAIIVKTHTFTGKKTTERLAKNLNDIGRIDSINTTMFSTYHLDLINNQNEVLFTSENKDFNNDFINLFIESKQIGNIHRRVRFYQLLILRKTFFFNIPSILAHFLLH